MSRPSVPYSVRDQHVYIPGKTRHGKTTLMHRMVCQDIRNGAGVTVIDPKGDFVPDILDSIPPRRRDDVIAISLDNPVPIDFLDYRNDDEKEALLGEVKYLITKGTGPEHAPLMNSLIINLFYTLIDYNENPKTLPEDRATLLDMHYFLSNEGRRKKILSGLRDKDLINKWENDFPNPKDRAPTIIRMDPFIHSKSLTKIFGCPNPKLNIPWVMDNRKILLVSIGGLSEIKEMFGTILLAKIQQAMFRRAALLPRERVPHFLYVDELQNCQTAKFNEMLSMAGGYGLRLCLANQFLHQLDDVVKRSIFGNVSTYIVFAMAADETNAFKTIAYPYDHQEIARLPQYRALFKIAQEPEATFQNTLPPPTTKPADSPADLIRKRTIEQYACPARKDVPPDLPPDLESKRDDSGPTKPFHFNQGKTRGPGHPR